MKKIRVTRIGISKNRFTRLNQKSKYTFPKSKMMVKNLDKNRSIVTAPIMYIPALNGQQQ
jgi:hypothetical protein